MSAVSHEPSAHRFVIKTDGEQSVLDYRLEGDVMTITHTGVPNALSGRGLAGDMTRAAFEAARAKGWKVVPACSYVAGWVEKHAEFQDLLA
ncbi:MAG: GNAT family N-acetyltransferase [Dokdonella sp.]